LLSLDFNEGSAIDSFLAGQQGVFHERTDGHGTYTAGNGSYIAAQRCNLIKLNVAAQAESALLSLIGYAGRAYIDDNGSGFNHIGCNESGLAECSYDDVGLTALLFDIYSIAVADCHGAVAGIAFLHKQHGHRLAYYVASAQYDTFLTAGLNIVAA
jgi:hypothetical protein